MNVDGLGEGSFDPAFRKKRTRQRVMRTGVVAAAFAAFLGDRAQHHLVEIERHQFPPIPPGSRFTPSPWVPVTWAFAVLFVFWVVSVIVVRVKYGDEAGEKPIREVRPIEVRPVGRWHWVWVTGILIVVVVIAGILFSPH